jgi:hypothetical protein
MVRPCAFVSVILVDEATKKMISKRLNILRIATNLKPIATFYKRSCIGFWTKSSQSFLTNSSYLVKIGLVIIIW